MLKCFINRDLTWADILGPDIGHPTNTAYHKGEEFEVREYSQRNGRVEVPHRENPQLNGLIPVEFVTFKVV